MTNKKISSIIDQLSFPENLSEVKIIKPSKIKFDLVARLKCFNCGLFGMY
jgi:hypothetical protein